MLHFIIRKMPSQRGVSCDITGYPGRLKRTDPGVLGVWKLE